LKNEFENRDGAQGADHLRFIFYRMGFNDQEIVALTGGHNLGLRPSP
jgi:cytochrome c peroxidase